MWIAIDILVVISFFSTFFWLLRIKYLRDIAPSKKYPQGHMVAEFWQETGQRRRKLVPVKANGIEIEAPTEHKRGSRYFFDRAAVGRAKYPTQPLLPFSFLQVDCGIVSWIENYPNPINPKASTITSETITIAACPQCSQLLEIDEISKHLSRPRGGNVIAIICPICQNRTDMSLWFNKPSTTKVTELEYKNIITAEGLAMIQDTDSMALGQAVNEEGAEELAIARANRLNKQYVYILLIVCAVAAIGAAVFAYQSFNAINKLTGGG